MNMEIRCLRCKEQFEISKEQLKKIDEIKIGKVFRPKDYLRFFPLISSECNSGKGHDFVFTDAFTDKKKTIIQEYDEVCKYIEVSRESLKLMADKEKELSDEREKLTQRLDVIRYELFTNGQSMNNISLVTIPEDEDKLKKILDQFENLVGTRDIELWKGVAIPKRYIPVVAVQIKKEEKKEDDKK